MSDSDKNHELEIAELIKLVESHPSLIRTFREGSIFGMLVGSLVLLGGFASFFLGLSGAVDWVFKAGSISSKLINASPGAIFSAVGLIIMWKYKPKVKTEMEIKVKKSLSKKSPDIQSIETTVNYKTAVSSPAQIVEVMKGVIK